MRPLICDIKYSFLVFYYYFFYIYNKVEEVRLDTQLVEYLDELLVERLV